MKQRAYGYVRVSGQGQVNGDGFPRQEKAIRDYAKTYDVEVVKIFREEGVSGNLQDRPTLARLLVDLEQNGHGVKTVIIEKVDRLARDLMVQEAIINDLKKKGFNLISALEGDDLLSGDPTRKLVRQVLGAIAEYEKTMIVLKLRAARQRKRVMEGKCEGQKGYREVAPEIIHLVRTLRHKPKDGVSRRKSFREIADTLNSHGRATKQGKQFTDKIVSNILYRARG